MNVAIRRSRTSLTCSCFVPGECTNTKFGQVGVESGRRCGSNGGKYHRVLCLHQSKCREGRELHDFVKYGRDTAVGGGGGGTWYRYVIFLRRAVLSMRPFA